VGNKEEAKGVTKLAVGKRRFGKPRTNKERAKRHKRLHPRTRLPKRGTGLKRRRK